MIRHLVQFFDQCKLYLFLHFKIMAENLKIPQLLSIFILLLSSLQNVSLILTAYKFSDQNLHGYFISNLTSFLQVIQPIIILKKLDSMTLYVIIYLSLILFSIFTIVYMSFMHINLKTFKEKRYFGFHYVFLEPIKFITMIWLYMISIFIFQVFYSAFFCLFEEFIFGDHYDQFYLPLSCEKTPTIMNVMVILFVFPMFYYGLLSSTFFCIEKFEMDNNLANSSSNLNLVNYFYKFYLVIINFRLSSINPYAVYLTALALQFLKLKILLSNHNFFNFNVEKAFFTCLLTEIFVVLYLIFLMIIGNSISFEMLFSIFLILFIKVTLMCYGKYLEFMLAVDFKSTTSLYLFDKKLKFLYYFILKQEIKNDLIIYDPHDLLSYFVKGSFSSHSIKCSNFECFCHQTLLKKVYDYKTKKDYVIKTENKTANFLNIIYIKHFLRYQYADFIKNFRGKNAAVIKLKMSYFLSTVINNYHKSVVECIEIKELKHKNVLSLQEEFLLERILMDMDAILLNLNRNYDKNPIFSNLNFEELMEYERNYLLMEKAVQNYSNNLLFFYVILMDEKPKFDSLYKYSTQLNSLKEEVSTLYSKNHSNPRTILFYKEFLRALLFIEDEEVHLDKMLRLKQEKIQNYKRDGRMIYDVELMYNENSILIQISTTNSNLGNIYKVNKGAAKYLGYSVEELESSNINIIMPKRIHENHDQYLRNYMESGRGNVLYQERKLFLRKKDGFLSFVSLITKPMFDLKENIFKFVGYMQPLKDEYELIVTDETGVIDGISRKLGHKLQIFPNDFEKQKIYIQNLCPSLAEYYFRRSEVQAPVYEFDFENYPKSSKNFPILKFFQFSNKASSYKYQIDTLMHSLGIINNND